MYNDELYHWKYIKKVKKNGKWRYYYDGKALKRDAKDALGYDERAAYNKAKVKRNVAQNKAKKVEKYFVYRSMQGTYNDSVGQKYIDATMDVAKATIKSNALYEKYKRTPLGMLDTVKETINSGVKWIKKKLKTD